MYFSRPLSLCILYTALAYFGFVVEQGLINLNHLSLPTQEKRRVDRHQPPATDVLQVLIGLDPSRFADLGLLCSLGVCCRTHQKMREFGLVKEGACPEWSVLDDVVVTSHSAS